MVSNLAETAHFSACMIVIVLFSDMQQTAHDLHEVLSSEQ